MKRIISRLLLLLVCLTFALRADASPQQIYTVFSGTIDPGQTIKSAYHNYILPKFPAGPMSSSSAFSSHFQVQYSDQQIYNFVYLDITRGQFPLGGALKYKIEVSYQINNSSGFHDGALTYYGYPGDSIDYVYTDGSPASARIVNNGASGHGSWDHTVSIAWVGTHPSTYQNPFISWGADSAALPHAACSKDLPAQDTPGSSSHVSTLTMTAIIWLADGSFFSIVLDPNVAQNNQLSPPSCALTCSTGTVGPYTYNVLTTYGGG